ncbi:MAG TPA: LuxR family transcriptional regulator [Candidatus Aquilonibacter sp.]
MGNVLGRNAELERSRAIFDSAERGRHVRALRIGGPSGVGKTALADALGAEYRGRGWIVAPAPSFQIHATFPLFAARRVIQELLDALGEDADRYKSGLTVERDRPEDFEEAFVRIIEGVTLDHRLVIILDDAQWADPESRALIARTATTLADRAIVVLSTERSDEAAQPALALVDESVVLDDLSPHASNAIVLSIYPDVSKDVADAIAAATRGHAMDLVAVATAARENGAQTMRDVSESTRRVVARDLATLDPETRTFLQVCALIDEPIEFSLLQQLWPQEQLLAMMACASGRYLVAHADGLRFVHATIMESVLETIPIEIPMRYRIIEAIKKLPSPRIEDLERLVKQSAACGDRELERSTLMQLADVAASRSMGSLSVDALERAIGIRAPDATDVVQMYTRISQLYNTLGRELETIRTCQAGIAQASSLGIEAGIGSIAASMILALWHAGRNQDALAELQTYERRLTEPQDRTQILSAGMYVTMNRNDRAEFDRLHAAFVEIQDAAPPFVQLRLLVSKAFMMMRSGQEASALSDVREAEQLITTRLPPFTTAMTRTVRTLHAFRYRGIAAAEEYLAGIESGAKDPCYQSVHPHVMIARGNFSDAAEFVLEHLGSARDPLLRRFLLSALATATALRGAPSDDAAWSTIASEAALFEGGLHASGLWPIAAAWNVSLSSHARKRARALLEQLFAAYNTSVDAAIFSYPIMLTMAARNIGANDVLELLARDPLRSDLQPWNLAQAALARAAAASFLKAKNSALLASEVSERFEEFHAPYFARFAQALAKTSDVGPGLSDERVNNTTRREREIAALVAEGLTNRLIAEKLVLSERTVEGHIANLFAKVNVSSRTQLAAWYLRTTSSVA